MQKQKINKNRVLGVLCIHGHEYKSSHIGDTGKSLRYKCCRSCCVCNALSVEERKAQQEAYRKRPKNKKKMSKYQKQYRKNKKQKHEKKYQGSYYLTVTKPKRKRDRHNKKLLRGMNHP